MRERGKARERPSAYATRRPPRFRCTSSSDIAAGVTPEIRIACPSCGLRRHHVDAVHCKARGVLLNIPNDAE